MSIEPRQSSRSRWKAVLGLALACAGCLELQESPPSAERTCTACHGDEKRAGDVLNRAAPPGDLDGNRNPQTLGVGAHERHLGGKSHAQVPCQTCHVVPQALFDPGHVDSALPAEVTLAELARAAGRQPTYDAERRTCTNTYCHGDARVDWTAARTEQETCGSCHGLPPPLPHPQRTACSECHGEVLAANAEWVAPERHIDGKVDVNTSAKCATCHGRDPETGAPAPDLSGRVDASARGVGAHTQHLSASATHGAMACSECHQVPTDATTAGHIDGDGRAEVVFGALAKSMRHRPTYAAEGVKCSDTYCHGATTANWNAPRASEVACGSCHDLPPPLPHSQAKQCSNCHGRVMREDGSIKEPNLHVNGTVEVDFAAECQSCHGTSESAAPPRDLLGNTLPEARGVGAHRQHVSAGSTHAALACNECHLVPETVAAVGHLDGDGSAEVVFGSLARTGERRPSYDQAAAACTSTYCHGGANPDWQAPRDSDAACGSCHALPPPNPHPVGTDCSSCHAGIDASRRFVSPSLHVNGKVDLLGMTCNACHGSGADGAPPADTLGNTHPGARGVGAHALHLQASASHGPVACSECHDVPVHVDSPGHRDTALPAEVAFGTLARNAQHTPNYSPTAFSCSDIYCHGRATPNWLQPLAAAEICGSCHGVPPAGFHPQRSDCGSCHSAVMNASGDFAAPERHVDGKLDLDALRCNTCHGSSSDGAPAPDLAGNTSVTARGVGSHALHLQPSTTHASVACGECHRVPSAWDAPGHADSPLPAEISFGALARAHGAQPEYVGASATCVDSYCHGDSVSIWTAPRPTEQVCGSCHGLPPALPHPQAQPCSICHAAVIDAEGRFLAPGLHVDGVVQVDQNCGACHGSSTNAAPPNDLLGGTATSRLGVGAHQVHLSGGSFSRALACSECHLVPTTIPSAGHLDLEGTSPADVRFQGPAAADAQNPRWDRSSARCSGSYCHGPLDPFNESPSWIAASGGLSCTSCHGMPPPAPHTADARCSRCHGNVDEQGDIVDRGLHVNGEVDFN